MTPLIKSSRLRVNIPITVYSTFRAALCTTSTFSIPCTSLIFSVPCTGSTFSVPCNTPTFSVPRTCPTILVPCTSSTFSIPVPYTSGTLSVPCTRSTCSVPCISLIFSVPYTSSPFREWPGLPLLCPFPWEEPTPAAVCFGQGSYSVSGDLYRLGTFSSARLLAGEYLC